MCRFQAPILTMLSAPLAWLALSAMGARPQYLEFPALLQALCPHFQAIDWPAVAVADMRILVGAIEVLSGNFEVFDSDKSLQEKGLATLTKEHDQYSCQRRRQTSPHGGARVGQVSASFYPRIASLFGLREPLLRPDLRSPQPSRAAAVKEARRAPRSGAQRPGRPRARRHPHRSRTTRQLSRQTIVTSRPPATGNAVVRRLGADLAAIAVRF